MHDTGCSYSRIHVSCMHEFKPQMNLFKELLMKTLLSTTILFIIVLITPAVFAQTEQGSVAGGLGSPVAGRFYPGNETALKGQIAAFFKNVPGQAPKGAPIAIISPMQGINIRDKWPLTDTTL